MYGFLNINLMFKGRINPKLIQIVFLFLFFFFLFLKKAPRVFGPLYEINLMN